MRKTLGFAFFLVLVAAGAVAQTPCDDVAFVTETLPDFVLGDSSHVKIEVTGADRPYRFELTAGVMPDGIHLTHNGGIRGVPREAVDNYIWVTVTDDNGCSLTKQYLVRVVAGQ